MYPPHTRGPEETKISWEHRGGLVLWTSIYLSLYRHDTVDKENQQERGFVIAKSTNDWMDRQHMYIDGMHRRQGRDASGQALLRQVPNQ